MKKLLTILFLTFGLCLTSCGPESKKSESKKEGEEPKEITFYRTQFVDNFQLCIEAKGSSKEVTISDENGDIFIPGKCREKTIFSNYKCSDYGRFKEMSPDFSDMYFDLPFVAKENKEAMAQAYCNELDAGDAIRVDKK